MPPYPASSWARLGEMLVQRRVEIDPRYRNRRLFAAERGLNWRLLYDIERAKRTNFESETLAAIEVAYSLVPGSIPRALGGAELEAQPDAAAVADVITVMRQPVPPSLPDDELPPILRVVDEAALEPFTADAVRSLWLAIGVDPGRDVRPMTPEWLAQIDATYTAADLFSAEGERMAWEISQWPPAWRLRLIAIFRMAAAEALGETGRSNAMLTRDGTSPVSNGSRFSVVNPAPAASG